MAAEVKGITCPKGEWTAIATAKAKVLISMRSVGNARLFIGAGEPAAGLPETDYLTVSSARPVSLNFDDTSTNVRLWAVTGDLVVEVVRQ